MADDTIASNGTFTLFQPLTGGSNIDFLNEQGASGELVLKDSAFALTTITTGGSISLITATIGGAIQDFQPGDQVTIQTIGSLFNALDASPTAAADNAAFANQITFASQSGVEYFIAPDGAVTPSINDPVHTLDANTQAIIDEMRAAMFGTNANTAELTLSFVPRTNPNSNHPFIDGVFTTDTTINPCFLAGTRILTLGGEVVVEDLKPGDIVVTCAGEERAIKWVGRRAIDITRHPRPEAVQPIIIEPGALAHGVPARRLMLSPDHALFLDGVLVPAKDLTNWTSIRQNTAATHVTYFHVELASHDILIAEGAAAESFLDTGHRGLFENADEPLLLHPDLMQARREAGGCAPLCTGGESLAAIRRKIAARTTLAPPSARSRMV